MKRFAVPILLIIAALCPAARAQDAAAYDLAGRGDRVWLLRADGPAFNVFTRKAAGEWSPVGDGYRGAVEFSLAGDEQLNIFFTERQFASLSVSGSLLPETTLPAAPQAACYGPDGEGASATIYLLAGKRHSDAPVTTAPASQPASAPTSPPAELALYRLAGDTWQTIASVPVEQLPRQLGPDGHAWSMAATAQEVVLACQANDDSGQTVLLRYRLTEKAWQTSVALPDAFSRVYRLGERLVLLGQVDVPSTSSQPARASLGLQLRLVDAAQGIGQGQPLQRDGKTMIWPARPYATAAGERLLLLWRDGQDVMLASCGADGNVLPPQSVTQQLGEIPTIGLALDMQRWFFTGLLIALLVIAFMMKPKGGPKLVLPPMLIPGNLIKRGVAAILDFGPFVAATAIYLHLSHTPQQLEAVMDNPEAITLGMTVSVIAMLSGYVLYGAICEARFGATLGKKLLGLRTVGQAGQKPDLRGVLLRNLLKIFELATLGGPMWWFFVFLAALPAFTRYRQRLGDMMGRTAVVEARFIRLPSGDIALLRDVDVTELKSLQPDSPSPPPIPPELREPDGEENSDAPRDTDNDPHNDAV